MKKTYMKPDFATFDLGETAAPLCASLGFGVSGSKETNKALSVGLENPWDASCWAPAEPEENETEKEKK